MIIWTLIILAGCVGWCLASAFAALWWVEKQKYDQLVTQPIMIERNGKVVVPEPLTVKQAPGLPALQKAEVIIPELDAEARVLRAVSSATKERAADGILEMAKAMKMNLSKEDAMKQAEVLLSLDAPEMPYV